MFIFYCLVNLGGKEIKKKEKILVKLIFVFLLTVLIAACSTSPGCFEDADGDGYGNPNIPSIQEGYVKDNTDCDDTNASINPGADETPDDGIDNNCDGLFAKTYCEDSDGDGYGNPDVSQIATSQPEGYVADDTDCDDTDASINPVATEIDNDGIDQDCNGCDYAYINVPGDYGTIQEAIDAVTTGCTIQVGDGTYTENINFKGKAITVQSVNGAESTTIDGGASRSVVRFNSGEGADSVLNGFTITNGFAVEGGGISCVSSPTITNCTISGNSADLRGGGISCDDSSPTITNCTISSNSTGHSGGGISCWNRSSPLITNCTISGNSANGNGSGIYCDWSSPTITNCTISGNSANGNGGGIYMDDSNVNVLNSIFWGDTDSGGSNEIYLYDFTVYPSSFDITYSDIQGSWEGEGNIDADPLFVGVDDYHLTAGSPCIDVGTSEGAPEDDIDGDLRDSIPDMGSDEYIE